LIVDDDAACGCTQTGARSAQDRNPVDAHRRFAYAMRTPMARGVTCAQPPCMPRSSRRQE
jgi:hypothetical protein